MFQGVLPAPTAASTREMPGVPLAPTTASTSQERQEPASSKMLAPLFTDMSKEKCAWVSQRLRGASAPFLLTDEEFGTDEDGTPSTKDVGALSLVRLELRIHTCYTGSNGPIKWCSLLRAKSQITRI